MVEYCSKTEHVFQWTLSYKGLRIEPCASRCWDWVCLSSRTGCWWLMGHDASAEGRVEKIAGRVVVAVLLRVGVDTYRLKERQNI